MKTILMLVLAGALVAPSPLFADPAFDAGRLGRMRGILDTCSKVSPIEASHYLLQMKTLIGNATKADVDQSARTSAYQDAYQSIATELRNMDQDGMTRACASYLTASD